MKERGKGLEVYSSININNELFAESSTSSDFPCKRHPQSSSSVGICAYCLKDRLVNLVCSDCGEQRLSSCSCSEISSNRNSCGVDVGSVGRVSFLIENDKQSENNTGTKTGGGGGGVAEEVLLFKRSNSSCVEIKKKNGLWRIGRLFRKSKRESSNKECGKSVAGGDEKSEMWVVDYMGVSRSRSLCSFRGNGLFGSEDGGDLMSYSGARSSISAARSSGVNLFDPERRSGFSESEPRKSGFDSDQNQKRDSTVAESELLPTDFKNRRIFSLKDSYFTGGDESGFIDLKFDFPSEAPGGGGGGGDFPHFGGRGGDFGIGHDQCYGGSCRITVNDRGIKKSRKSFKGWRWIFKHHPNWISGRKKDEDVMVNP